MRTAICLVFALVALFCVHVPARADTPMTFFMETDTQKRLANKIANDGFEDIYASGEISEGTVDRFLIFVRDNKIELAKIHFNSPGGSLIESMKLGQVIRSLKFFTAVGVYSPNYDPDSEKNSICASACAYAFAGGTSRFLDAYTGKLGIHQFYTSDDASVSSEVTQQVSGLIVAYLDQMGIDAKAFTISTTADRNGIIWLTPNEALRLRFANNGDEPPVAEIKISDMMPYLRIEQEHYNVTIRVLFICEKNKMEMEFGIVTDQASSAMYAMNQKRSYLEIDYKEFLVIPGATGAKASGSVVWITRTLAPTAMTKIIKSNNISGWIDGFGAVRYGGSLDILTVREKIIDYSKQCYK